MTLRSIHPVGTRALAAAVSLLAFGMAGAADLPTPGPVVNIVEWDGNSLPPVYERSSQLPLTEEDLLRLAEGGFVAGDLAATLRERRYAGDVSAEGLLRLRQARLPGEVIRAASLHALPPNRAIDLTVTLEFDGQGPAPRRRYLYVILPDGGVDRVFTADLAEVLGGKWRHDVRVDGTDLLLSRATRRVAFTARVPLKEPGVKTVHAFTSARPGLRNLAERPASEASDERPHDFAYPASSLIQDCRLLLRFRQDRVLPDRWALSGSFLECEWN